MAHFVDGGKWGALFERSDLTLHGGPRLATEYRRTVRSAGKSRISARTVCKSAARAFSAIGRPAVAPQGSPPARHSMYRARRGNPRRSSSRVCRSEEHTSELQSQSNLVCRLLLEKKN